MQIIMMNKIISFLIYKIVIIGKKLAIYSLHKMIYPFKYISS